MGNFLKHSPLPGHSINITKLKILVLYSMRLHVDVDLLIVVALEGHLGMDCLLVVLVERSLWVAEVPLQQDIRHPKLELIRRVVPKQTNISKLTFFQEYFQFSGWL